LSNSAILTQTTIAPLTMVQPGFRTPYVNSWFIGITSQLSGRWTLELNDLGSLGRKLVTTDLLNRGLNPSLGLISYRGNQGSSSYNGFSTVARYRAPFAQFQLSYTWSHTIDNQSEILLNDYFNLSPVRSTVPVSGNAVSAFSRQFDSSADRGNSDFDQRHNLAFFSFWDLPAVNRTVLRSFTRDWKFSQIAAFRSGLPYSVLASYIGQPVTDRIFNNRLNLVDPAKMVPDPSVPAPPGGQRLLSGAAFTIPPANVLGNTGRNAFRGPGFYNLDISLSRSFPIPWMGESARFTFRADAYNLLNHTNLIQPGNQLRVDPLNFGLATYGQVPRLVTSIPDLAGIGQSGRQVQLFVRLTF